MTNVNNEVAMGWGNVGVEDNNGGGQTPENKLDFLKLPFGDTKVRILDASPVIYKDWWSTRGNGGQGNGCSVLYFPNGKDLLEAENKAFMSKIFKEADAKGLKDKARKEFLRDFGYKKQPWGKVKDKNIIHVLDRATGEIKLLDAGNGVFNAIKALAMNAEYGDPRNYDITITKTDSKGQGNFQDIKYTVTAARSNTPLTADEKALYEEKKIDLKELKTPNYTPEQALLIAKGATFQEVLGNGSDSSESVSDKSDTNMLPQEEKAPTEETEKPNDENVADSAQEIDINKEGALSEEELANISFE
ncbi:hypothetical protein CN367_11640 [Priestia megaterium]|uniref:hypothetical protein n=1 Tax=Priestia megaterium TaxID=1404 RepID=UPI000BF60165|nr:hypothetical protein [Priestia megaterium]PEZ47016.1 hypothetical protein CN367_11640 [Priestia megaterium]